MSDTWGYENGNAGSELGNNNDNGPKALRDAYEAMKAQNAELQNGLAAIQKELRDQKLQSVFNSLGVPGAEKIYQGEPDPEKAQEWVTTMRSVFGNANTQGETPQVAAQALDPSVQDQYQRMSEAGSAGQPLTGMDAAFAAVNDATDVNALISAFQRSQHMG